MANYDNTLFTQRLALQRAMSEQRAQYAQQQAQQNQQGISEASNQSAQMLQALIKSQQQELAHLREMAQAKGEAEGYLGEESQVDPRFAQETAVGQLKGRTQKAQKFTDMQALKEALIERQGSSKLSLQNDKQLGDIYLAAVKGDIAAMNWLNSLPGRLEIAERSAAASGTISPEDQERWKLEREKLKETQRKNQADEALKRRELTAEEEKAARVALKETLNASLDNLSKWEADPGANAGYKINKLSKQRVQENEFVDPSAAKKIAVTKSLQSDAEQLRLKMLDQTTEEDRKEIKATIRAMNNMRSPAKTQNIDWSQDLNTIIEQLKQ